MKALSKFAALLAFALAAALPAQAAPGDDAAQQRLKVALNDMVQDVRQTETPSAKRAVMERFLGKAEWNLKLAELVPFASAEKKAAIDALQAKFDGYQATLDATRDGDAIADVELDAFAGFMQQDLEQAATSGGIYLSTGAIIIILLILILIT